MTWWDTLVAALAAVGIKVAVLVSSAVGGFLSLRFFDPQPGPDGQLVAPSALQKWTIAIAGTAMGVYLSGFTIAIFQLTDRTGKLEVGMGVLIGLFGMSLAAAVMKAIRELNLKAIIESWTTRR